MSTLRVEFTEAELKSLEKNKAAASISPNYLKKNISVLNP